MMMQMLSAGAMGGGISSAVARALGGGRRDDADALVLHAIIINVAIGALFAALVLVVRTLELYRALGGEGGSLAAALAYSNIVFAGTPLVWLMNALASVIRGTGNMLVPALAVSAGVVLLVPLSPCLIFGLGPFPALGIAGAGIAVVSTTALTAAVLALYLASGRAVVHFAWVRPRARLFAEILRVGAVASVSTLQTTLTVVLATALVGAQRRAGSGRRIRHRQPPRIPARAARLRARRAAGRAGRDQSRRRAGASARCASPSPARRSPLFWPRRSGWRRRPGPRPGSACSATTPAMRAAGAQYLRIVGPAYGFFGMGLSLYFASQGAGRLLWPLLAGLIRLVIAIGGGWIALRLDRLAGVAVRRSRLCPRGVWPDDRRARSAAASGSRNRERGR